MKKFLTLVLALVLVFGLSVPAMAFTSDDFDAVDHPYDLSIYLVEYDDNDLFGLVALPESDRGYAKNEIVAAVVELFVPKNEEILDTEYATLVFGGDNVDLDVTDNYNAAHTAISLDTTSNVVEGVNVDTAAALVDDEISMDIITIEGKDTFKWLFFAKVTDDEASLYAKLVDGDGSDGFYGVVDGGPDNNPATPEDNVHLYDQLNVTLDGTDYSIILDKATDILGAGNAGADDLAYQINWTDGDGHQNAILVLTDKNYKSIGMAIDATNAGGEVWTNLGVNTDGELGIVSGAVIKTDGTLYDDVMDIYEDVVVDVFGMDYFNIGHYVRKSFFEDLVSADTISATVDIEPWTAYVTVPDNIIVDPPKTGDAASIMGFVMIALSGAGAVALKKRG